MATTTDSNTSSSPCTSKHRIDESELEQKLFLVYNEEVKMCDEYGQSTQHIGDEWMRREIRRICGFDVSDRWIKMFRRKHGIRYFSGRRHADKVNKLIPLSALETKVKTTNFLKERRVLRTSRKEYEEVDLRVNAEIVRRQTKGERLTNPWIREYAQNIASQLHPQIPDIDKFFDANWLYRFKRRYCVELKPRSLEEFGKLTPPLMNEDEDKMNSSVEFSSKRDDDFSSCDAESYTQAIQNYFNFWSQNGGGISKQQTERIPN